MLNANVFLRDLDISKQMLRFEKNLKMPRGKSYNHEDVLEKAMNVFWENGYEATSVRQLEKEMGINQFSIYAAFTDKRNLFVESMHQYRSFVKSHVFQNLLKQDAGIADILKFLNDFSEKVSSQKYGRGCLIVNTVAEVGAKDEVIFEVTKQYFEFVRTMFREILIRSGEAGELSSNADVEKCANYLVGVMQGISVASKVMNKKQLSDFILTAVESIRKL
jgi:TetR/AcrR family transcriptional repressor of nem operon